MSAQSEFKEGSILWRQVLTSRFSKHLAATPIWVYTRTARSFQSLLKETAEAPDK